MKLVFNRTLSHKNSKFFTFDIGNFYLCSPLKRYEYVCVKLSDIPNIFITAYGPLAYT